MRNKPILILGCQRSGTTLLNLILDSHPQIHGFDEMVLFPIDEIIDIFQSGDFNIKGKDFTRKQVMFLNLFRSIMSIPGFQGIFQNAMGNNGMLPFKLTDLIMQSFTKKTINSYLINPQFNPFVSFQIPTYSANFSYIKQLLPDVRILWCLRDPRDVITSMIRLQLPLRKECSVSWAAHPFGASTELKRCLPFLTKETRHVLSSYLDQHHKLEQTDPVLYSTEDTALIGALCWRVKNELLAIYERDKILVQIVGYEQLVSNTRQEMSNILRYLQLPWHDDVLKHHQFHTGIHIGKTDRARPIDQKNTGKWQGFFSDQALQTIHDITTPLASKLGYGCA